MRWGVFLIVFLLLHVVFWCFWRMESDLIDGGDFWRQKCYLPWIFAYTLLVKRVYLSPQFFLERKSIWYITARFGMFFQFLCLFIDDFVDFEGDFTSLFIDDFNNLFALFFAPQWCLTYSVKVSWSPYLIILYHTLFALFITLSKFRKNSLYQCGFFAVRGININSIAHLFLQLLFLRQAWISE